MMLTSKRRAPRLRHTMAIGLMAGGITLSGCAISPQQEAEMGAQYATEINQQLPIVTDNELNRYINALGSEIAAQGGRHLAYRFYIVNAEPINAMAVPGGYIYINRGLIEAADNVSELAGVLGHEIGHVEMRHSVEQMERMQKANIGLTLAYVLMGRAPSDVERAAIDVGGGLVFANYSRDAENEADRYAIPLLMRAGIHPRGLSTFFHELIKARERNPGALEGWFSSHPTTEDRIAQTEAALAQIPSSQLTGLQTDSQAFQNFKARMARYQAPPPEFRNPR